MDHYQDISKALSKLDRSRGGSISVCRMHKVLQDCGCSLTEEELTQLLHRFALAGPAVPRRRLHFPVHSAGCHRDSPHIFPRPGYLLMRLRRHKAERESNLANAQQRNHHSEPVFILSQVVHTLGQEPDGPAGLLKNSGAFAPSCPAAPSPRGSSPQRFSRCLWVRHCVFLSDKFRSDLLSFYCWAVSADFPSGA